MKITIGDYTLNSDYYNFWITKKYQVKNKDGTPSMKKDGSPSYSERQVTGYHSTWTTLMASFARHGIGRSDAETMRQLMADVKQLAEDAAKIGIAARENDFKKDSE